MVALWHDKISPGANYSKNVGFKAASVLVDNYSAYWLYFPDADAYVPPFYAGVVLALDHTTDYAQFSIQSPFSTTQAPTATSYFVHLVWSSDTLSPTPGAIINDTTSATPPTPVFITNQCCTVDFGMLKYTGIGAGQVMVDGGGGITAAIGATAYDALTDPNGSYGSGGNGLANGKLRIPQNGNYRFHFSVDFQPSGAGSQTIGITLLINAVVHNPDYDYTSVNTTASIDTVSAYAIVPNLVAGDLLQLRGNGASGAGFSWTMFGTEFGLEFIGA